MPLLDMSDVLNDPDLVDYELSYTRYSQTVGQDGLAVDNGVTMPFQGVVTSARGAELGREPGGERISQSIMIITETKLIDGRSGYTADVVTWNCRQYTVAMVDPYPHYGYGFVQAVCDLIPMSG